MRKKILIVVADYYKNISKGLLDSTKKHLKNSFYNFQKKTNDKKLFL